MRDFGPVSEQLRRSTVQVLGGGSGSGIIQESSGVILTNAHVARQVNPEVELWDGTRLPARVTRRDARLDLAALQVQATGLPAASWCKAGSPRPGELAIAVGNPLGFTGAVSTGVVHTVGSLGGVGGGREWVQSTVRLAPGNSGGPLANARGEVIGVNTMIVSMEGGGSLALAIPAGVATRFLTRAGEDANRMGVTVRPVRFPRDGGVGFLVLETEPGSPAERASLLIGDLLVGANGRRFRGLSGLEDEIAEASGPFPVQFRRGGAKTERTATLLMPRSGQARAA